VVMLPAMFSAKLAWMVVMGSAAVTMLGVSIMLIAALVSRYCNQAEVELTISDSMT
jgi:hypothetical protein